MEEVDVLAWHAAAFVSQSLNAVLTKRSPLVRLLLFVVGLISLGAIIYKYLGDKSDAAQKLEYGDSVNLDVVGQIKSGAAGNYFVIAGGSLRAFYRTSCERGSRCSGYLGLYNIVIRGLS
jgi:hypothetical protein